MRKTPIFDSTRLSQLVERAGLSALITISPENLYYTSGYVALEPARTMCATLIFPHEHPVLLTPISDYGSTFACKDLWIEDHRFYGKYYMENADVSSSYDDFHQAIHQVLEEKECGKGKVGIEDDHICIEAYENLRKALLSAELVNASALLAESRMIKTPEEIRRIKEASRVTEEILEKTFDSVEEGMTELELARILKGTVTKQGGDVVFIELASGPRGGYVNNRPTEHALEKGEILRIDFGIVYNGYASDTSRDAVIGEATEKVETIHNAVLAGQQKAINAIRPGLRIPELFKIGIEGVREHGFLSFWRYNIGHGIGLETHEAPRISPTEDIVLKTGMVVNIEMPYYLVGLGGFNIEDTVLVKDPSHELLSEMGRDLYVL